MNTITSNLSDYPINKNKKRYKVLLCAGGGLFGYVITYLMSHLDYDVYEKIDIAAGTSIGGILTILYTCNSDYKFINKLFKEKGKDVFQPKLLGKLACPRYDNDELGKLIGTVTRNYTLADVKSLNNDRLDIIIPTLDMTLCQPRTFTSIGIKGQADPYNISLQKLGLYTAAAPTYFPVMEYRWNVNENVDPSKVEKLPACNQRSLLYNEAYKFMQIDPKMPKESAITDGGVIENIPIITTYTTLKSLLGVDPADIDMLVLGTGDDYNKKGKITADIVNSWNLVEWLTNFIIPFVTESNETTSVNWGAQMGFHTFKFFNPLNVTGAMDDPDILPGLEKQCDPIVDEFKQTVEDFLNA